MNRCLELAKRGMGKTSPNPMVGSVIVNNGKIIGEGYHMKCGEAHAEVNAINSIHDQTLLKTSTLYVNLEPCSHYGRTPPCSKLILEKGIRNGVVGCIDRSAKGSGKGVKMLRDGGCEVTLNIKEEESINLNKRFFTFHSKKRPYIILKWAETKDGFIDIERNETNNDKGKWITNNLAKILVHKWRSEESAIMIGTETAKKDNPKLNVREWIGESPLRIVIDKNLRLNPELNIFDKSIPTIVYTSTKNSSEENLEYVKINFDNELLNNIMDDLHKREVLSIIIEGGSILLSSIIKANLWDEARIFTGNVSFGNGVSAPKIIGKTISTEQIGDAFLDYIINNK